MNHMQTLRSHSKQTPIPPRPSLWPLPWSWNSAINRLRHIRDLFGPKPIGKGARIGVVVAGVVYTILLGILSMASPGTVNFDFFYLFGCALMGWAAGQWPGMLIALVSGGFLFFHDSVRGNSGVPPWIIYWNSLVRLLGFGGIAWLAGQAGGLARNLDQVVRERTESLRNEADQHRQTAELLEEAIQLFRQVTENITDVFWVTDATKSKVEYISPGFERVWGKSCDELYASPVVWQEGIHPEDRQRVARAMFRKQATGDYDEEYRVIRPDSAICWVHDRAFPVKDESGAVYRIVGIAEDISERKQAEQLLQAERDLGAVLSSTSDLHFAVSRVLEITMQLDGIDCGGVYLMDERTGQLRLEAHHGLPGSFVERVSQYKADSTEARLARAGQITYVGHEHIPRSLEALWGSQGLRALAVVPLLHKGVVLGMLNLASFREDEIPRRLRLGIELIASQVAAAFARIRAEESSRRNEAHVRTLINGSPLALLAFDGEGTLTFEDGQALGAMGIKSAEHLGRSVTEVFNDFPLMLDNLRRALEAEQFSSILQFGDNVLECRFTPLKSQDEPSGGFVAVATNITERFRLEQQILEISDREQARLGQDVHDGLCQQLVGAAFVVNSLQQALASEQRPEAELANRISSLLDESITESRRVARGLYPVRLQSEGLAPALSELAASARERFKVHCLCQTGADDLQCDTTTATHLYRIAQEAVNNAVKHSGAGNIVLRLSSSPEGIDLEIKDDGKGIPEGRSRHSGMGLYIMDYRARSLGGELKIANVGGGTRVSCHVPRKVEVLNDSSS